MLVREYCKSSRFSGKRKAVERGREGGQKGPQESGAKRAPLVKAGILRQQGQEGSTLQFTLLKGSARYRGVSVFGMNKCTNAACLACVPLSESNASPPPSLHTSHACVMNARTFAANWSKRFRATKRHRDTGTWLQKGAWLEGILWAVRAN